MHCDIAINVAISKKQRAELGLADARRVLQDRIENRPQVSRRRADDAQNIRCRGLLPVGLREFAGKPGDDCFLTGNGSTAIARGLWRIAALRRGTLATLCE